MKKTINTNNGTTSLVLGILSLCFIAFFPIALILGIIGLVFANKQNKIQPTKNAEAGKIMSIISICISSTLVLLYVFIFLFAFFITVI